jgi:hypothetical protein
MLKNDDFLKWLLFENHLLHNYLVYRIHIVIFGISYEFRIQRYKFGVFGIISGFSGPCHLRQKAPILAGWLADLLLNLFMRLVVSFLPKADVFKLCLKFIHSPVSFLGFIYTSQSKWKRPEKLIHTTDLYLSKSGVSNQLLSSQYSSFRFLCFILDQWL